MSKRSSWAVWPNSKNKEHVSDLAAALCLAMARRTWKYAPNDVRAEYRRLARDVLKILNEHTAKTVKGRPGSDG